MYEVKFFIENKQVEKMDDKQRKAILEKALSAFNKKSVKISYIK